MYLLAWVRTEGSGTVRDDDEGITWLTKAAKAGHPASMGMLGECYYLGRGTEKNWMRRVTWFEQGAVLGDLTSMTYMGFLYANGEGVAASHAEAEKWFRMVYGDERGSRKNG